MPCVSEKIFRPWDEPSNSSDATCVKQEPRLSPSAPSEECISLNKSADQLIHQHYQAANLAHHFQQPQYNFARHLINDYSSPLLHSHPLNDMQRQIALPSSWINHAAIHRMHRPDVIAPSAVPSMEQFLASLEAAPEKLHPHQLAALGMGPNDIGELYNMAGFKSIHHLSPSSAATASSTSSKKPRPKRFRCPHCQVAFSNNGQLKGHVRSHTGNHRQYNSRIISTPPIPNCADE